MSDWLIIVLLAALMVMAAVGCGAGLAVVFGGKGIMFRGPRNPADEES